MLRTSTLPSGLSTDMIICVSGDTHGALDRLYADVDSFERTLNVRFEVLLNVGDFGVWPDPKKVDRATRDHEGAGDFPRWLAERRSAPRPTWFIKGNHEDFEWIDAQDSTELIPGLRYIPNGHVAELSGGLRVAGIGGCFGPSDYERQRLYGYAKRHYMRWEIEKLEERRPIDILLLHDAPRGIEIIHTRRRYTSNAEGLDLAVAKARPRVCFFGHHHARVTAEVAGVLCLGLNIVGRPGYLVAVEMHPPTAKTWKLLGEWPPSEASYIPVWSVPKEPTS